MTGSFRAGFRIGRRLKNSRKRGKTTTTAGPSRVPRLRGRYGVRGLVRHDLVFRGMADAHELIRVLPGAERETGHDSVLSQCEISNLTNFSLRQRQFE